MGQILTNKYNLPDTLVKASVHDSHRVGGDISVTQLIDAPKIRILKSKYDYEVDVSENIYALMGTALHHILERANIDSVRKRAFILTAETIMREADNMNAEAPEKAAALRRGANWIFGLIPIFFPETAERYVYEVTLSYEYSEVGMVLYGTFDIYDKQTATLYDYKFCSVYQYMYEESRKKWFQQTNIYANMLRKQGYIVNFIRIVAFFRDWHRNFNRDKDYPPRHILEIPVPVYSDSDIEAYIIRRLKAHKDANNGIIPDCTGEERWASGDIYAVMVAGVKRAHKRFDSKQLALMYVEENRHKLNKPWIQLRPGESRKCAEYCPVAKYCDQRKKELEEKSKIEDEI